MSIQTNIEYGKAVNKLRKLQKQWSYWFPLRQQDPLRDKNAEQQMAERECSRIAPLILDCRRIIDKAERA